MRDRLSIEKLGSPHPPRAKLSSGGFLCLETAGDRARNELLLCVPCLPPGRAGSTTWASDLGLTLSPCLSGHASSILWFNKDCISAPVAATVLLAKAGVSLPLKQMEEVLI